MTNLLQNVTEDQIEDALFVLLMAYEDAAEEHPRAAEAISVTRQHLREIVSERESTSDPAG